MTISSYKQLDVYRESLQLVLLIHRVTEHFPSDQKYGLTSQLRRAAYSVPMNLAEGYGRGSRKDYANFVAIDHTELEEALSLVHRISMMLTKLRLSLTNTGSTTPVARDPLPETRGKA